MPGTHLAYCATIICLRACYAMSGTDLAYGATRRRSLAGELHCQLVSAERMWYLLAAEPLRAAQHHRRGCSRAGATLRRQRLEPFVPGARAYAFDFAVFRRWSFNLRDAFYKYCSATGQCRDVFGEPAQSGRIAVEIAGPISITPTTYAAGQRHSSARVVVAFLATRVCATPCPVLTQSVLRAHNATSGTDLGYQGLYACRYTAVRAGAYRLRILVGSGGKAFRELIAGTLLRCLSIVVPGIAYSTKAAHASSVPDIALS
eukprot:2389642-Rhodomonas_salina.4